MLRQLLALFALIAGLSALPAAAEVRHSAQSGRLVELSASAMPSARASVTASVAIAAVGKTAQYRGSPLVVPAQVADLGFPVLVGVDRAHE